MGPRNSRWPGCGAAESGGGGCQRAVKWPQAPSKGAPCGGGRGALPKSDVPRLQGGRGGAVLTDSWASEQARLLPRASTPMHSHSEIRSAHPKPLRRELEGSPASAASPYAVKAVKGRPPPESLLRFRLPERPTRSDGAPPPASSPEAIGSGGPVSWNGGARWGGAKPAARRSCSAGPADRACRSSRPKAWRERAAKRRGRSASRWAACTWRQPWRARCRGRGAPGAHRSRRRAGRQGGGQAARGPRHCAHREASDRAQAGAVPWASLTSGRCAGRPPLHSARGGRRGGRRGGCGLRGCGRHGSWRLWEGHAWTVSAPPDKWRCKAAAGRAWRSSHVRHVTPTCR
jgi:hypothetical protein